MKKLLLATTIAIATFATPVLAEGDCASAITKLDTAIQASKAADDTKLKVLELRETAAKQQAAGDEKSCLASAQAALEALGK